MIPATSRIDLRDGALVRANTGLEIEDGAPTSTSYRIYRVGDNLTWPGGLHTAGGQLGKITTVTASYTVLITDDTIVCNSTAPITLTFPEAVIGQCFDIKNINTGTVTVQGDGTDTIDGAASQNIAQWNAISFKCYAANKWSMELGPVGGLNPLTQQGEMIIGGLNGVQQALNKGNPRTCLQIIPSWLDAATFTGTLDDAVFSGTYSGAQDCVYEVEIDSTGTPDTFRWRKDTGAWTSGVEVSDLDTFLSEGLSVRFGSSTGHDLSDNWLQPAYASYVEWNTIDGVLPLQNSTEGYVLSSVAGAATWTLSTSGTYTDEGQIFTSTATLESTPIDLGSEGAVLVADTVTRRPVWATRPILNHTGLLEGVFQDDMSDVLLASFTPFDSGATLVSFRLDFEYSFKLNTSETYETGTYVLSYTGAEGFQQKRVVDFSNISSEDLGISFSLGQDIGTSTKNVVLLYSTTSANSVREYVITYRFHQLIVGLA